ncbi:TetR/AcrR family transcriptional regulator [Gorillibacterium sp. sgz5001074]|uniref:TetR/AcrR family transcriptional regulator n=1 Tax=Gorillibacterium sp. sgz5001074 TaxID=3446695 RepID=UPI003F67B675
MKDKKAEIYSCGKELFQTKGFKDTNVSDITEKAGVAVGTFYNYYSSKDKLFMEIYLDENAKLKMSIMESVNPDDEPAKLIKEFLAKNLEGMNSNPILKMWYNRDVFGKLEQMFREDQGGSSVEFLYGGAIELVRKWQAEGKMRTDIDSELIMAMFSALIQVDTHKEEIGIQYFPHILDYLTDFVLRGLTDV